MINIFQPNVGKESIALLQEVFASNWLGRGTYVSEFERSLSKFLGIDPAQFHTLASCTDAIFYILKCMEFKPGQKVILPSNSFPAIPSAIVDAGLCPVVVDIDSRTGNINLEALLLALDNDCVAIFVTDYGGIPNDINKLREVAPACKILLDGAASLGTFVGGNVSGLDADFVCWSFDAMKLVTCGEGGGVYIKDTTLMRRFKEYTYLGLPASEKSGIDKSKSDGQNWWEYQLQRPGVRSVFTNVNAAIGLPQLAQLPSLLTRRAELRENYLTALEGLEAITVMPQRSREVSYSNYFFTIRTPRRDELASYLLAAGVYTSLRYFPVHLIDIFKKYARECPNADSFAATALNLPIHSALSNDEQQEIIRKLRLFFE